MEAFKKSQAIHKDSNSEVIHCFDHPPLDPLPPREVQEGMILPSRQGKVRCFQDIPKD
jgi:hypothetical protein